MIIKLNGGSSDLHMISLNDMKKLSDSIQKISYNYEFQEYRTKNKDIFIQANKEGSFEILLGMIDPSHFITVAEGVAGAYLYDLINKMKSYTQSDKYTEDIKELLDSTYKLAIELAQEEYFDVSFTRKKQTIENNIKKVNAEFSNYNAMKQIASIVGNGEEKSLKPTSISLTSKKEDDLEVFEINNDTKAIFEQNESKPIRVDNIIISGIPDTLSRSSKSFNMEMAFLGKIKVRATDKQLTEVSNYFGKKIPITIELEPIVKMGELVETRDAKLINIIED